MTSCGWGGRESACRDTACPSRHCFYNARKGGRVGAATKRLQPGLFTQKDHMIQLHRGKSFDFLVFDDA